MVEVVGWCLSFVVGISTLKPLDPEQPPAAAGDERAVRHIAAATTTVGKGTADEDTMSGHHQGSSGGGGGLVKRMNKHGKCKFEDNKKTFTVFTRTSCSARRRTKFSGSGDIQHSTPPSLHRSTTIKFCLAFSFNAPPLCFNVCKWFKCGAELIKENQVTLVS